MLQIMHSMWRHTSHTTSFVIDTPTTQYNVHVFAYITLCTNNNDMKPIIVYIGKELAAHKLLVQDTTTYPYISNDC